MDRYVKALQDEVNRITGTGKCEITAIRTSELSGQFVLSYDGQQVQLGGSPEAAMSNLRKLTGVGIRLAQPKVEWKERRGRPKKND